jgi:hypothetical protein
LGELGRIIHHYGEDKSIFSVKFGGETRGDITEWVPIPLLGLRYAKPCELVELARVRHHYREE